jgi:3-oxoacyl-[acyl-carrier-protein] synthase II
MDKVHQYAVVAGKRALRDAGLWGDDLESMDKTKCGVLVGSAMGGMQVYEDNVMNLNTKGIKKVSPFTVPYMLTNMSGAILGMQPELGFRGPNYALNTACATSNYQFINAAAHIRAGQAEVILAGGTEAAVTPMGLGGFIACKALSKRNDDPTAAAPPWGQGRGRVGVGEGAGVLVMESLAHAKKRGARVLCEYMGGGISTDAYDLTSPRADGRDVILCMRSALSDAMIAPDDVDLVNAHGTSTPVGDLCEVAAVNAVFGGRGKKDFKLNSTKSMLGHQLGASGALEAIACIMSIEKGAVHPTINHDDPEDGVDFDVVPNEAQDFKVRVALSNSFGFGGHNSSVVFGKFEQ